MTVFVDPSRAKQFECAICMEIYVEPVQIGCQEHIFCKQCIDQLIVVNGRSFNCPLCQTKCVADTVTRVKFIDRQIRDLKVKCPNKTKNKKFIATQTDQDKSRKNTNFPETTDTKIGQKRQRSFDNEDENMNHNKRTKLTDHELCEWIGSYSDLKNHIKICPLERMTCEYCYSLMLRRELEKHHTICLLFPMKCAQCRKAGIYRKDMTLHIAEACPMALISCNKCQQEITRKDDWIHKLTECQESLINCRFYPFGCREKLKRKDEKKHIENAAFTHAHLIQLANHQLKLEGIVNTLKRENKGLDARINILENKLIQIEKYGGGNNKEADNDVFVINDALNAQCYVCGNTGNVMRCSQCKSTFYCSREHQVSDWTRHSMECKKKDD